MKKQFLLMMAAILIGFTSVNAQGGGQSQTAEERTKGVIEKMAPLGMTAEQTVKSTAVLTDFFNKQQDATDEMRSSGSFDREAFGAKRKELSDARDAKLKEVLSADQFKKWVDEIEPATRPQRRN